MHLALSVMPRTMGMVWTWSRPLGAQFNISCACWCNDQVLAAFLEHLLWINSQLTPIVKDVNARRAEVRKYQTNPAYKKKVDDERRAKKKAEVGRCVYT